ncbi:hypothetical protein [Methylobacterium crusticola]|uniref:hypothetical protein n=1 Tax=Methylobacterium crusticola TaxID=1697972 RepID=UPI000FFBFF97|nr:hypothetical protein [Methylobacterium crusticola]
MSLPTAERGCRGAGSLRARRATARRAGLRVVAEPGRSGFTNSEGCLGTPGRTTASEREKNAVFG